MKMKRLCASLLKMNWILQCVAFKKNIVNAVEVAKCISAKTLPWAGKV